LILIVSNPKIKLAFEELKENTENIQEQAKAYRKHCGLL
jgi:hypothetical protein